MKVKQGKIRYILQLLLRQRRKDEADVQNVSAVYERNRKAVV